MLALLQDAFAAASLAARCKRVARERVLRLLESQGEGDSVWNHGDGEGRWEPLGGGRSRSGDAAARVNLREAARRLAAENPHARNVLRLMDAYVFGADCRVTARTRTVTDNATDSPDQPPPADRFAAGDRRRSCTDHAAAADALWREFLTANAGHFSDREFARRVWRDGECFLRLFPGGGTFGDAVGDAIDDPGAWPPAVRFVDPERIGPTPAHPDSQGILTHPDDAETPVAYLRIDPATGELAEAVPAAAMLHARINADSNEARGVTLLAPLIGPLCAYERWLDTELTARRLAASVVLWRKVEGGPAAGFGSPADDGLGLEPARRERFTPGSILTTSRDTDLTFLQPPASIADAAPLGRMILLAAAAGAGLPEFMLTADAANANYSSTMVAEGSAVRLFQSEQRFFAEQLSRLWRWVMRRAAEAGRLPSEFVAVAEPVWTFPSLVARDRPRERYADVALVRAGVLSRAEVARRENVDPAAMREECAVERAS